ncbi:MAG: hypothetical protein ACI9GW_001532 [Halieaceae bacterium]|jgi:uncharacterized protein YhjY with autotransporter beta-barrel domain
MNYKIRLKVLAITLLVVGNVHAANPELQDLFFAACVNPSAALAARCAETDSALGNLSGDSESSLNPSQSLSGNQVALRAALSRSEEARTRAEGTTNTDESVRMDIGKFSLLFNVGRTWEELDRTQDRDEERGYDADSDTLEVGFDYRLSNSSVIGLQIVSSRTDLEFERESLGRNFTPASDAGEIQSDTLGVTAFLAFGLGEQGYMDISLGMQSGEADYQRNSVFQESNRVVGQTNSLVKGSADTDTTWASINAGWQIPVESWSFGIQGGLTFSDSEVDSFVERDTSGSGLAMRFSGSNQQSLVGTLGLRLQRAISTESGVIIPYASVTYGYEFEDDANDMRAGYVLDASANSFQLSGDKPDSGFVTSSIGISTVFANGWMPFLDISYWSGYEDLDRLGVRAGLRKEL